MQTIKIFLASSNELIEERDKIDLMISKKKRETSKTINTPKISTLGRYVK